MAENKAPHEGQAPQESYEVRDVNVPMVTKVAIGLVALCLLSVALVFGLFKYFESREAAKQAPAEATGVQATRIPPEPKLQTTEPADLKQIHASEDQILGTYGWVDRQKGIVRLPIARAMELLAKRGLPARQQAGPQTAASGVSVPTESGLGTKMIAPGGPLAGDAGSK